MCWKIRRFTLATVCGKTKSCCSCETKQRYSPPAQRGLWVALWVCSWSLTIPALAENADKRPALTYIWHVTRVRLSDLKVTSEWSARVYRRGRAQRVETVFPQSGPRIVALCDGEREYVVLPDLHRAVTFSEPIDADTEGVDAPTLARWFDLNARLDRRRATEAATRRFVGAEDIGEFTCVVSESIVGESRDDPKACRRKVWKTTLDGVTLVLRSVERCKDAMTVESVLDLKRVDSLPDDLFQVPSDYTVERVPHGSLSALFSTLRRLRSSLKTKQ